MPALPAWTLTPASAAGLAVLLVLSVCPGVARAGCGDHVVILSKAVGVETADTPPAAPPPCRGPNCSLNQSPPLAPLAPGSGSVKPIPPDALLAGEPAGEPIATGLLHVAPLPSPADHPAAVFRPPRVV